MKTFREYLEGREVNESFFRNAALAGAAGALMGFGGGEAQAQSTQSSQPRLTASEKGQLKSKYNSRSELQQKMADAGKYNIAANKVGVQASHVMYQIVNITGGDFQDDIKNKYGQKELLLLKLWTY